MDLEIFIKLMGMTTSRFDGEALVALRKANAMLMGANLTWQELLAGKVRVAPSQAASPRHGTAKPRTNNRHDDQDEINALFEAAFAGARGSFKEFLDSIHEWWEQKLFLTDRQYEALRKAARQ